MTDRILEIIRYKGLVPAQFAELINVQRSAISHLISGRNNPSLEMIRKILSVYPEINAEWLLTGKGNMITEKSEIPVPETFRIAEEKQPEIIHENADLFSQTDLTPPEISAEEVITVQDLPVSRVKTSRPKVKQPTEGKQVEKIVWFFKDRTFQEYYPED